MKAALIVCFLVSLPSLFLGTNALNSPMPSVDAEADTYDYIVFMSEAERPHGDLSPYQYYISVLTPALGSENAAKEAYVDEAEPYTEFFASLTPEQASVVEKQPGVLYLDTV